MIRYIINYLYTYNKIIDWLPFSNKQVGGTVYGLVSPNEQCWIKLPRQIECTVVWHQRHLKSCNLIKRGKNNLINLEVFH